MANHIGLFRPGEDLTMTVAAGQTVAGGDVVDLSGAYTVQPSGADSAAVLGVALFDAAAGEKVTVATGGVHTLNASGAIAAGEQVISAAGGDVATKGAGTNVIGIALGAAANNRVDVLIRHV